MKERGKTILLLKKIMIRPICLIVVLTLFSCATATDLSTRASGVRLVNTMQAHDVEAQCRFLGNVQGTYFPSFGCLLWFHTIRRIAYNNALNELLDNAAELGATHIFVNLGDYPDLRGEAYCCCYCKGPDGKPDEDYCQLADGSRDAACCEDSQGKVIGAAYCKYAEGKDPAECKANAGTWVAAIDEKECEDRGGKWIPEAENRQACEVKGGIWLPIAEDQVTCEEIKGGTWILDEDILRRLPSGEVFEKVK